MSALAAEPRRSLIAEQMQRRNDESLREAFRPVVAGVHESVVTVRCAGKDVAMGTIVGADGWIITKASQLTDRITCRLSSGRELPARLVSENEQQDLAMLKVDASAMRVAPWGDAKGLQLGQWVATAGPTSLPIATGVFSVARRMIPSRGMMLGVQLEDDAHGPKVIKVVEESGAARAGIKVNDVILAIAGLPTPSREDLLGALQDHRIGTSLQVKLLREGKEMEVSAILGKRPTTQPTRAEIMNQMGGALSLRSNGFPDVFQHDTVLKPTDCGSPLVDLDGKVVGINISRAGRTESYAIPSDVVIGLIEGMKTGTAK
jgi:serine protease Do